jgi:DNA-binding NarL/FixJ family response regulator
MDISLRETSGIEAMRRMLARRQRTRVLMFSMHEEPIYASRALQAGAWGYVTKASAPEVLVEAVHTLARGNKYLSADIAQVLALRSATAGTRLQEGLSAREFEILRLLVQGRAIAEIAQTMGINAKTVANYQSSIKQKLGVETPVQLLRIAETLGLEGPAARSSSALREP